MPTTIEVHPWPDPVIDTLGHDPRSAYAEMFWLPTLGPTSLLLLRRIATALDEAPYGMVVDVADLAEGHAVAGDQGHAVGHGRHRSAGRGSVAGGWRPRFGPIRLAGAVRGSPGIDEARGCCRGPRPVDRRISDYFA